MRIISGAKAGIVLVHPAPALAVTLLSAALGAVLLAQAGARADGRLAWTVAAVLGSQIFTGAMNDLVDRGRDEAAGRVDKPLASGALSVDAALWIASAGVALQIVASLRIGPMAGALGAGATLSALAYNLWLSRTPLSVVPYLVSFGLLPLWVAAGVDVPLERVLPAVPLAASFATAAHLANVVRDFEADRTGGSRSLPQVIGRDRSLWLAYALAMVVGIVVGLALAVGERPAPAALALSIAGLAAVAQGAGNPTRLWYGMLAAAVCWTGAWAMSTG